MSLQYYLTKEKKFWYNFDLKFFNNILFKILLKSNLVSDVVKLTEYVSALSNGKRETSSDIYFSNSFEKFTVFKYTTPFESYYILNQNNH